MKKFLLLLFFLIPTLAMAGTISNTADVNSYPLGNSGGVQYNNLQKFWLPTSGTIQSIELKFGPNSGTPTGTVEYRIENFPAFGLADPNATKTVTIIPNAVNVITFDVPFTLNAGCYYIVPVVPNQSLGDFWNQRVTANDYARGFFNVQADGGAWTAPEDIDEYFVVNYTP